MAARSFYTTFQISKICEVNPTTVQNWVKENKLKAYTTPGGHRRVRREDLIDFLHRFDMPVPRALTERKPFILIVDDEPEMRDMLTALMESSDREVEVASVAGGVEALLVIGERKPDLLVLDIMMPGMNGFDVCTKLKSRNSTSDIKIVAITGYHDEALRDQILSAGADLFYTKPLNVVAFREESMKLIG